MNTVTIQQTASPARPSTFVKAARTKRSNSHARILLTAVAFGFVCIAARPALAAPASCESLSQLKPAQTTIDHAQIIPVGPLQFHIPTQPAAAPGTQPAPDMPEFCRVQGTIRPTSDSDIKFEVWLPTANWNGRFENPGNGALGGYIIYPWMASALREGYATAQTDTGHATQTNSGGDWAIGHPEKVIDFAYRAEHLTTVTAKAVIAAFYGSPAKYSYWNGCSRGGGEALAEVQRYPDDYNGVIGGADGGATVQHHAGHIWVAQAIGKDPASVIPASKLPAITKSLMDDCDAADGVKDGVIRDPRRCGWNPETMICKGADGDDCLTAPQAKALNEIYEGAKNAKGETVTYGYPRGTEGSWVARPGADPNNPGQVRGAAGFMQGFVFDDANWDWKTFDFDKDFAMAEKKVGALVDNIKPDISAFRDRGGKLINFSGWSDTGTTALEVLGYYESVQKKMGNTDSFYRLFMFPGMGHCGGGVGPNQWDHMKEIIDWVENGKAPDQFIASRAGQTRPICAYPKVAKYNGTGSTDDAANFVCAVP